LAIMLDRITETFGTAAPQKTWRQKLGLSKTDTTA
jgi:hypothetical protein